LKVLKLRFSIVMLVITSKIHRDKPCGSSISSSAIAKFSHRVFAVAQVPGTQKPKKPRN
jgi:hypothetical protein